MFVLDKEKERGLLVPRVEKVDDVDVRRRWNGI